MSAQPSRQVEQVEPTLTSRPGPARLRVVHRTDFAYERTVPGSFNEARITPSNELRQSVVETRVAISPVTWQHSYTDYWGTRVTAFEVLQPHDRLTVTSTSVVDVREPDQMPEVDWQTLRRPEIRDARAEELRVNDRTEPGEELLVQVREVAADLPPAQAAHAVCRLVSDSVTYTKGVTGVHTRAREAWEERRGVCQDFAHLCLGALRSIGIPARYVSGYLHPRASAPVGETVTGESHAWVEWWTGSWYGWDPTNDKVVGPLHVVVGRGREYGDVTPLKGIIAVRAESRLSVQVEVTRLS